MSFLSFEIKTLIDRRDHRICRKCGYVENSGEIVVDGIRTPIAAHSNPINIHHILPRQYGGSDSPSNLITLCRVCHSKMHVEFQARYFKEALYLIYLTMITRMKAFLGFNNLYDLRLVLRMLTGSIEFRGPQKQIIENVLAGRNTLVVMPTGAGKSICFQTPGLVMDGESMVIAPLKTLVKDQVQTLQNHFITATYIDSDLGKAETLDRIEMIRDGLFKFVYMMPERFFNEYNSYKMAGDNPLLRKYNLLVIDEAHCVVQWGRLFRPAYSQLKELRRELGNIPTIALTASASKKVQQGILSSLGIEDADVFVTGFYRPEIQLQVMNINELATTKEIAINHILSGHKGEKIIIFVPTINIGKKLYDEFHDYYGAELFYAQREEQDKRLIQNRFSGLAGQELNVLITTSAFGMGINIPNIRMAIHYSLTANIEDYYQQFGRAGRDRIDSYGVLLYEEGDEKLIRYMNEKTLEGESDKTATEKRNLSKLLEEELQTMLDYIHSKDKWQYVLDYFGEKLSPKRSKSWTIWILILVIIAIIYALIFK